MNTVTIPKEITRGEDLVVMPRKDYEKFLGWQKTTKITEVFRPPRKFRTYKPTTTEKREIKEARKRFVRGEYVTIEELRHELGIDY